MSTFIYPYKAGSNSVAALRAKLDLKIIKTENSKFKPSKDKTVINWGCSALPKYIIDTCNIVNKPEACKQASNKLDAFNRMKEFNINIPPFTTDIEVAAGWLKNKQIVVARTILNGHSGRGIVIFDSQDRLDELYRLDAPLYTMYIPKLDEFRIHSTTKETFLVQKKGIEKKFKPESFMIRNHENGFIFLRQDINVDDRAKAMAQETINVMGLDFGAVDIIYNKLKDQFFVLEVNTAPGLQGTTVDDYANMFNKNFGVTKLKTKQVDAEFDNPFEERRAVRVPNILQFDVIVDDNGMNAVGLDELPDVEADEY